MFFYISKDALNIRDKPNGTLLGTMRKGTIVYALSEPFECSGITWINIFAYDMDGIWRKAYSAVSKGEDIFLEPFIPSTILPSPYKSETRITRLFGENPAAYARFNHAGHNGVDFSGIDKNIFASAPGMVTVGLDPTGYGNYVIVTGATLKILYAHLMIVKVENGSYISQGTHIGIEGSTGFSSGSHLHFEIRRLSGEDAGNRFGGRIDSLPYIDWKNIIFPHHCSILNGYR